MMRLLNDTKSVNPSNCGKRWTDLNFINEKIVGGHAAFIDDHSWMVKNKHKLK